MGWPTPQLGPGLEPLVCSDQALNHSSAAAAAHILPVDSHKSHNPTRRAAAAAAAAASDKQTIRGARPRCTFCNYYSPCNNIFRIFSNIVLRILHVLHTVHIFFKYFSYFQCIICKTKYIITTCSINLHIVIYNIYLLHIFAWIK
jgi:hypothetical protein